jgi:hypothetical protein
MGSKRLKARTKNLPYLKCTFRLRPREFIGAEILMRYKDKGICRVVPICFGDVMDEDTLTNYVLPSVKKAFLQLKEIIDDAK